MYSGIGFMDEVITVSLQPGENPEDATRVIGNETSAFCFFTQASRHTIQTHVAAGVTLPRAKRKALAGFISK